MVASPAHSQLKVKVAPKAARNALQGYLGDTLKLSVTAAPEKGKANEAVERLLAKLLDLPRQAVTVTAGHTAQRKTLRIDGLDEAALQARLAALLAG